MRRFLSVIAATPRACRHRPLWHRSLGPELLAALSARGLLAGQGRADWFPCDGACGGQSTRTVLDEPLDDGSWLAICGHEIAGCDDMPVSDDDLTLLTADPDALGLWLRESLGATGRPVVGSLPGAHGLGQVIREGELRDAFLVVGTLDDCLRRLLDERARARTPSVVFVPTLDAVDTTLAAHHAPGSLVTLESLLDLVSVVAGRLVLAPPRSTPPVLPVREPVAAPYAVVVATRLDATGSHPLTTAGYEELIAQRASFDLLLDATAPGRKRGCVAHVRLDGVLTTVDVPASEAAVLIELIGARRPLRRREIRSVQVQHLDKLIERARRCLEGEKTRGQWRFLQTLSGTTPADKSYVFRPQPGLSFAAIVPLAGGAS